MKYNSLAITSFVFGMITLLFGAIVIPQILAVVFGLIALYDLKKEKEKGKWMAVTGISIGSVYLFITVLISVYVILSN